jgi:hypothetical protein
MSGASTAPRKILVVGFSRLHQDARICRQIGFIKDRYLVWAAGFSDPGIPGVAYIPLPEPKPTAWRTKMTDLILLKSRQFERYYWKRYGHLEAFLTGGCQDLIIANELESLPLAFRLAGRQNARVLFDAHEYAPREFEDSWKWRFLYRAFRTRLCRHYLPRCVAVTTVCEGIAAEYRKNFGVACRVITNAAAYEDLAPAAAGGDKVRLVHHGIAIRQRHIDVMIDVMKYLDARYTLDLYLVPRDPGVMKMLEKKIAGNPAIRLHPPLEMATITRALNGFDVGIDIILPTSFNNRFSLPNKFFTFVQARLAIAIGPSVEMASLVKKHDLGVVAADFSAKKMAAALLGLNREKISHYKYQAHGAARELSAAANRSTLLHILSETFSLQGQALGSPMKDA